MEFLPTYVEYEANQGIELVLAKPGKGIAQSGLYESYVINKEILGLCFINLIARFYTTCVSVTNGPYPCGTFIGFEDTTLKGTYERYSLFTRLHLFHDSSYLCIHPFH